MKKAVLTIALAHAAWVAQAQTVVYDNTTTYLNNNMPLLPVGINDSYEAGDDIWLAGTEREIVRLDLIFNYRGTLPGTMDLRIRFRELIDEEVPGSAFYDSGEIAGVPTLAGLNAYSFAIPHVFAPGHFVWTTQATNRQGSEGEIGPGYYNPATIGFSDDFFWHSIDGSDWTAYNWGGEPFANFAARLVAVPEPSALLLLGLAGVHLAARKRRK